MFVIFLFFCFLFILGFSCVWVGFWGGLFVVYCCFYLFVYDTTVCISSVLELILEV